ncbi:M15 family metallopeptidase [uncultured Clostridium sp.]|uniref:M15 family metallopeptidase n=1 Tax=uncultured Clostridium sp. TaxID=59620 RepID=UPI0026225E92|nr:M15 family metallopeptidase [uncultured Clostridium sp.]
MLKKHINKKNFFAISIGSITLLMCIYILNDYMSNLIFSKADAIQKDTSLEVTNANNNLKKELSLLISYKNDANLLLCNKQTLLPKNYEGTNLIESNLPFLSYITTTKLNAITATNAKEMFESAKKENIQLLGASGYRSQSIQKNLFNEKVNSLGFEKASEYSAPPRASEHETGYAIDIVSTTHTKLSESFEKTNAFNWLDKNAHKFGFILRYPKSKESITGYKYEPWHYRYVGVNHAKYIKENNLTLEEYVNAINEKISFLELSLKED